ncbi:MAG TPA: serine/threonine-protein kinase [Kofleriaceae bacterium]
MRKGDAEDALGAGRAGFLAIGDRLARFEILNRLGVGGMGVVYVAHDPLLDRQVAVKVLRADAHGELRAAELEGRLLREAQAMARLSHPNVVTVHEVGIVDRQIFIVMELNDGGTLRAWLKQEARPVRERIRVFIEAGRGLAAAHAVRLVHRDFKPDNVLLARDGRVRVVDFGLVRGPTAGDRPSRRPSHDVYAPMSLTMSGAVIGTPAYMAPEQHRAEVADHRSDQFSFCVALYEALYGRRPFAGENYRELVVNILDGSVLPPPDGADVPLSVQRVLERGLASAPDDRYPGMTALLDDLAAASAEVGAQTTLASAPAPGPTPPRPPAPSLALAPTLPAAQAPAHAARRRRTLALALAGGLVVASAAVSLVLALGLGRGDPAGPADAAAPAAEAPVIAPVDLMDAGAGGRDVVAAVPDAAPTIAPQPDRRHSVTRTRKATSTGDGTRTAAPDAGTPRDSAAEKRRRILELND